MQGFLITAAVLIVLLVAIRLAARHYFPPDR